jgi:hypothetical protein
MLWNTHATGNSVGWIYAHGFGTGIALYANPSEDPRASELNLQDRILHYNYRGLQVQNGAEYITFTGIQSTENNWGLDDLAANNFFNSCDFSINNHGANLEVTEIPGMMPFKRAILTMKRMTTLWQRTSSRDNFYRVQLFAAKHLSHQLPGFFVYRRHDGLERDAKQWTYQHRHV